MIELAKIIFSLGLTVLIMVCPIGATLGFMYKVYDAACFYTIITVIEFGVLYAHIKERVDKEA